PPDRRDAYAGYWLLRRRQELAQTSELARRWGELAGGLRMALESGARSAVGALLLFLMVGFGAGVPSSAEASAAPTPPAADGGRVVYYVK
ncbi:MAG TPA: hypothetical protein VF210_11270, partial [Pseudomonadales bacterium]